MRVLITGGAGFIGSNLVRRMLADGRHSVAVIDDFSTGTLHNLEGANVDLIRGSILDVDALGDVASGAEVIVHLAAVPSVPRSLADPVTSHEANATGTVRVLEAARRNDSRVILASSSSVYGSNPVLPKVETLRPRPISPYAVSKLAAESYALSYQFVFGVPALAFRFFNVYGPGQAAGHAYAAVVPAFVSAALAGKPLTIHGDGRQTRDFTFVDTVTSVITEAAERSVAHPDPVNLAFGTRSSLLDVIDLISAELGHDVAVEHVAERPGDVRDSQADSTCLQGLFPGLTPHPLRDGIHATVDWMKSLSSDEAKASA